MKKLTPADDFATRLISLPVQLPVGRPEGMPASVDEVRVAVPRACAEHGWVTASRHSTSLGTVVYSSCVSCGTHRAELLESNEVMPRPISNEVRAKRARMDSFSPHPSAG
ncbi:hypothetical protein [Pseudoclavibacter helvolus]|uniref:hypothetical protein n=1 Tax=Pseudoclavibacter helvolus TaxID=255205 RepID=UPI000ABFFE29|nr:hypothetical protein [Pseudoclavibacter helvolus]